MTQPPRRKRAPARPRAAHSGGPPGQVRIVGGQYRRTPITVPDAPGLRPTPDRVRETVFNWLTHLMGELAGTAALDLFAGSGALGFEMASRGAAQVVLVDNNAAVVAALRALQQRLGAEAVSVRHAHWRTAVDALGDARFDVIFLDPPFADGILDQAVPAARRLLRPGGLLYVESPTQATPAQLALWQLELLRAGRAGAVHFHLLHVPSCG